MRVDIWCYVWVGHKWLGWWDDYVAEPTVYTDVYLSESSNTNLYIGKTLTFDLPNGDDWSEHELGIDRHIIEAATVDFYNGDFTLEGFVHVEKFGKESSGVLRQPLNYSKQRWVVTRKDKGNS